MNATAAGNVVSVANLTKRFGQVTAVDDVSFTIDENTIYGLLGRNGAGKTTLMQLLTGQDFATSGTIACSARRRSRTPRVLQRMCFIKESQKYPDEFRAKHVFRSARLVLHELGRRLRRAADRRVPAAAEPARSRSSPAASSRRSA